MLEVAPTAWTFAEEVHTVKKRLTNWCRFGVPCMTGNSIRIIRNVVVRICLWPRFAGIQQIFGTDAIILGKSIQELPQPLGSSLTAFAAFTCFEADWWQPRGKTTQLRVQNLAGHPPGIVGLHFFLIPLIATRLFGYATNQNPRPLPCRSGFVGQL